MKGRNLVNVLIFLAGLATLGVGISLRYSGPDRLHVIFSVAGLLGALLIPTGLVLILMSLIQSFPGAVKPAPRFWAVSWLFALAMLDGSYFFALAFGKSDVWTNAWTGNAVLIGSLLAFGSNFLRKTRTPNRSA